MDVGDHDAAFADGRSDAFDRRAAHVVGGEDPRNAGLQRVRLPFEAPVFDVATGADVAVRVAFDAAGEPGRFGVRADEDEQSVGLAFAQLFR
jgi:hypothetical protein